MFKHIYENAIATIESDRARQVEVAKQKVMQEQVLPFNRDIDASLRDAITELQTRHNERISEMQKAFEQEKHALTEAAQKKKADNAEVAIATATAAINKSADDAIAHFRTILGKEA